MPDHSLTRSTSVQKTKSASTASKQATSISTRSIMLHPGSPPLEELPYERSTTRQAATNQEQVRWRNTVTNR